MSKSGAPTCGLTERKLVDISAILYYAYVKTTTRQTNMDTAEINTRRDNLSKALVNGASAAHYVVRVENERVDSMLEEQPLQHHAKESRLARLGRSFLAKRGYAAPLPANHVAEQSADQSMHKESIASELKASREFIKNGIIEGIDDLAVDVRLGMRTDDCILPPFLQELHRQAEAEAGTAVPFLEWMTDSATDEQLLNVWQWHDSYLDKLDNDPAFQERITLLKQGYAEGSQLATTEGPLHPDIATQEAELEEIRIVHGSPFSPVLATAQAYIEPHTDVVQILAGASDFTLYHEMTHVRYGGLGFGFDEGMTEVIAAEIYNRSHPKEEHVDVRKEVYSGEIAMHDAIARMTEGKVGLYETSGAYAGSSRSKNIDVLIAQIDDAIGLPIIRPVLAAAQTIMEANMARLPSHAAGALARNFLQLQTELFAAAMLDDHGNKVATTIPEIIARMFSTEIMGKYGADAVVEGLAILREVQKLQSGRPAETPSA